MSKESGEKRRRLRISLDAWAVAIALGAALLVRAGILKHIPW